MRTQRGKVGVATQVVAGQGATCAVVGGVPQCWGAMPNAKGVALKRRSGKPEPYVVPLAGKARSLSVGSYGAAAILEDGTVQEWWIEEDGTPKTVEGAQDIEQLSCSASHCCALDKQGLAYCWAPTRTGSSATPMQARVVRARVRCP